MKRSKGQVLVCFILLIPIILLSFSLIIDLGLYSIEKRKINNSVKDTVLYGVNHIKDSDVINYMKALLLKNINDIDDSNISIKIENDTVSVKVIKKYNSFFRIGKDLKIESSYYKNISNDDKEG